MEEGTADGTQREHQRVDRLGARVAGGHGAYWLGDGSYGRLDWYMLRKGRRLKYGAFSFCRLEEDEIRFASKT